MDEKKISIKKVIIATAVIIVLVLLSTLWYVESKMDYNYVEVGTSDEDLGINEVEIDIDDRETEYSHAREETMNILLLGVDGDEYSGVRSDIMMVLSINTELDTVKLTSVMRDTMALIADRNTYEKINAAYAYGGAQMAIKTINSNLDLDVRDFVAFNFSALQKLVDTLGGVEVYVDEEEINALGSSFGVSTPGTYLLDGEKALRYARIRKNAGGDAGRNERQREIIDFIFKSARTLSASELLEIAEDMMPDIYTSYKNADIIKFIRLYLGLKDGTQLEKAGFPFDYKVKTIDARSYVIPVTMESNVEKLHELIYGFSDYNVSDVVKENSEYIIEKSGISGM